MLIIANQEMFNSYEMKVSLPRQDIFYNRQRYRSGEQIFSHVNAFSQMSEISISEIASGSFRAFPP